MTDLGVDRLSELRALLDKAEGQTLDYTHKDRVIHVSATGALAALIVRTLDALPALLQRLDEAEAERSEFGAKMDLAATHYGDAFRKLADEAATLRSTIAKQQRVIKAAREAIDWVDPKQTTRMELYRLKVFGELRRALAALDQAPASDPNAMMDARPEYVQRDAPALDQAPVEPPHKHKYQGSTCVECGMDMDGNFYDNPLAGQRGKLVGVKPLRPAPVEPSR